MARGRPRATLARLGVVAGALAVVFGGWLAARTTTTLPRAVPQVSPNEPVTAMNQGEGVANNSALLAAEPGESRFVVLANRLDAPDFGCALQVSGDGGSSWSTAAPLTSLPPGADKCYAPEAAFGPGGTLYYLFVGLAGRGNEPMGAFLMTSTDRARTFSPPRQILAPLAFGVRMAVDPTMGPMGRLHVAWLQATSDPPLGGFDAVPNPIMSSYSDDGGFTFSKAVRVSSSTRARVVAPALALGPDHAVHVAYYDLGADALDYQGLEGPRWEGTWSVVLATSTDGGRTFREEVVDDAVGPPGRVMLIFTMPPPSIVAGGERVCAAWTDARHGDPDAVLRCKRGGRWGALRRLNDDEPGNGRDQYLPRLAVAPDGRLDAVFYDRRHDPGNVGNDLFFTFSRDGGTRFSPNLRVTTDSFDSRKGQQYLNVAAQGQVDFGARVGLLSTSTGALTAWTDTRNSRVLLGTTGQDLFAARVKLPPIDTRRIGLAPGICIALAGLALVLIGVARSRPSRATPGGES